jgi:outer membrane protein assembly factor BamE (lipoprotein component of BamABCDE complex)
LLRVNKRRSLATKPAQSTVGFDMPAKGKRVGDTSPIGWNKARRAALSALAFAAVAVSAACAPTVTKHGHHFQDTDAAQISPGLSQEQVKGVLGTPTTTATVGGGSAFYYISSTTKQTAFFKPDEVDRKVLAVYFSPLGAVDKVANYGLKDGRVVNFSNDTTKHSAKDESILRALFRNLGTKQLGLE